jgi:peptidoglycan/LPS O-acetylase OafA/YrhL
VANPTRFSLPVPLTLAGAFDPYRNALAFFRCVLATLVIVSHCYTLGGFGPDPLAARTNGFQTLGLFAVEMFFVLSGFLIARSAMTSPSVGRFLWHRFLRIFPGYWVCLIVCAFVIAPCVFYLEHGIVWQIFSAPFDSPQSYVLSNFAILHLNVFHIREWALWRIMNLQPNSVGLVFIRNPHKLIMNGSLWSLPYECTCYLAVALFGALGLLRRARFAVLPLLAVLLAACELNWFAPSLFQKCFPFLCFDLLVGLSFYFVAGAACYLYREKIPFTSTIFCLALALIVVALVSGDFGGVVPIAAPYLMLWLACKMPITRFDACGDFSYGLYIYAFPVQQMLAFARVQNGGLAFYIECSLLAAAILAFFSYRYVEAPCLRLKHLGRASLPNEVKTAGVTRTSPDTVAAKHSMITQLQS